MDQAGRLLNQPGKWQNRQIAAILVGIFAVDCNTLVIAFIGFQPKFACVDVEYGYNYTGNGDATAGFNDQCNALNITSNASSACEGGFRYDVNRHETIVAEWDLICDKAYLSEVSQVLYTVGMALGSAFISPISDRFGRKRSYLGLRFLYIFCPFGLTLSSNIYVFMAIRLLTGAIGMAVALVRFTCLMELSPVTLRPFLTVMVGILWAVTLSLESGIAQLMRGLNWRYFQAVLALASFTVILDVIFTKESILWLYANDKLKEASKVLRMAMMTNGMTEKDLMVTEYKTRISDEGTDLLESTTDKSHVYPTILSPGTSHVDQKDVLEVNGATESKVDNTSPLGDSRDSKDSPVLEAKSEKKMLNIIDLLKNKSTRKIVSIICFTWFVNSLVYYGIFLMSYAMAGDRILNFFLSAVVEIPSTLALYFCLRWCGRKKLLVVLHGLCAASLLLAGVFNFTLTGGIKDVVLQVVTFIGKFGISATFTLLYVYTTEVFPTNFRTSGLGMGSVTARIGSFLSPFSSVLVNNVLCTVWYLFHAMATLIIAVPSPLHAFGMTSRAKWRRDTHTLERRFLSPFSSVLVRNLPWGPGIIFGGLCLVLTFILLLAPETRDRTLPQCLEDIEAWESDKENKTLREDEEDSKTI